MIHVRISTDTLMSRRRIQCWSDWQAAAIYGKVIACWIMGAEKDVWTFFCPTREEVDRVFFFNPFSVEILRKVLAKIEDSYYENPREIQLFFYYPSDEYISELMTVDILSFVDEIDCRDLFECGNHGSSDQTGSVDLKWHHSDGKT